MPSVLFVCQGNICRSPAAETVLRLLAKKRGILDLSIDSCGVRGYWHVGALADERMRSALLARGYHCTTRAKALDSAFFRLFDLILASDDGTLDDLQEAAPPDTDLRKIQLMTEYSSKFFREEIPDPYLDRQSGFEKVLDQIEELCEGLLSVWYPSFPPTTSRIQGTS